MNEIASAPATAASAAASAPLWSLDALRGAEPALGLALIMLVAVVAADALNRYVRLPRSCGWMLVGALASPMALRLLERADLDPWKPMIDLAVGVLVFELGTRLRPRWLLDNPGLLVACVLEGVLAGAGVAMALVGLGAPPSSAWVAGAVAMSTSPLITLAVVHDSRPRGQVTERLLMMSAINSVLAMLALKILRVFTMPDADTEPAALAASAVYVIAGSLLLGAICGLVLERLSRISASGSMAVLQIAVVVLATLLAARWTLSPLFTLLVAGMVARTRMGHRLTVEPHLGSAGAVLTVLLFVCLGLLFSLDGFFNVWPWALAIIAARIAGKGLAVMLTARLSALSWRQGAALTLALQPMSGLAVLIAADSFGLDAALRGTDGAVIQALIVATTLMQLSGPLWTQGALQYVAHETASNGDPDHAAG